MESTASNTTAGPSRMATSPLTAVMETVPGVGVAIRVGVGTTRGVNVASGLAVGVGVAVAADSPSAVTVGTGCVGVGCGAPQAWLMIPRHNRIRGRELALRSIRLSGAGSKPLLVTQRLDRLQVRSAVGWIDSKEQADGCREQRSQRHGIQAHNRSEVIACRDRYPADDEGDQPSEQDADDAADQAKQGGLHQELDEDVAFARSERLS